MNRKKKILHLYLYAQQPQVTASKCNLLILSGHSVTSTGIGQLSQTSEYTEIVQAVFNFGDTDRIVTVP